MEHYSSPDIHTGSCIMNPKGLMWACKSEKKKLQLLKSDFCVQEIGPEWGRMGEGRKNLLQFQERHAGTQQNSVVLTCLHHFLGYYDLILFSRWEGVHTGLPSVWQQWAPLGSLNISQFWLLSHNHLLHFLLGPNRGLLSQTGSCMHRAFRGPYTLHMTLCRPSIKCS